ncbi:MAG: class I SAM-dependent methyltransferase, partial [Candidatus Aminicenantes bacterium]|nr:class I SAM-dependent methyltransferase [Candidatus Aminicenantes bacterium]
MIKRNILQGNPATSLYQQLSNYYEIFFPLKEARLALIASLLKKEHLAILDVGCADGELALSISRAGRRVLGIDSEPAMITKAREKAKTRNLAAAFMEKDMSRLAEDFPAASFDVVLCFGNTIPHLDGLERIEEFIDSVYKILVKGGACILQVVNYAKILANSIEALPVIEKENLVMRRSYEYDRTAHRILFKVQVAPSSPPGAAGFAS